MLSLDYKELYKKAAELREDILNMVYSAKSGHIGGDFSVVDILVSLYCQQMNVGPDSVKDPERDKFILSKGHSVEALYAVLADRGFYPKSELKSYFAFGSKFIGHPNNKINGIEMNSGSLGHGLSVCVGMALSDRLHGYSSRTYTVLGDGELAEGSVWEAFMSGSHYKLANLCAVIDRNGLQISGTTEQVMSHEPLKSRLASFGWNVLTVNGHDFEALDQAFAAAREEKDKPTVIIAETVKGKGVSFMENQVGWHHKIPSEEEYRQAMTELEIMKGGTCA